MVWANLPQKTLDLLVPPHKRKCEGRKCPQPAPFLSHREWLEGCGGEGEGRRAGLREALGSGLTSS